MLDYIKKKSHELPIDTRIDGFIVWSHGFKYLNEILEIIRSNNFLEIVLIEKYVTKNMSQLVNNIYSHDYAPIIHLQAKIKYLKKLKPEIMFIFVKNNNPDIDFFGENSFRHLESKSINRTKKQIRNNFNPKDRDGHITHDHIIHATDNESQANTLLKLIGYKNGVNKFYKINNIISAPYYITEPKRFSIININFKKLFCKNAAESKDEYKLTTIPIIDSIQYKSLLDEKIYKKYIENFRGTVLKEDYTYNRFLNLKRKFKYLDESNKNNFIIVKKIKNDNFIILDGLHRAALHLHSGNNSISSCVYE